MFPTFAMQTLHKNFKHNLYIYHTNFIGIMNDMVQSVFAKRIFITLDLQTNCVITIRQL